MPWFRLGRRWRALVVTVHAASGVGWLGIHTSVLVLVATAAFSGADPAAPLTAAATLVRTLVLPVSILALVTGLLLSLGTPWGLARHYWVLAKLVLTLALVLGSNLSIGPQVVAIAHAASTPGVELAPVDVTRTAIALALSGVVLLTVTVLSTTKPFGRVARRRTAGGHAR
ncbi:hypothetical protein J4H86_10050 [Spiractinospora alimapuensis]|nr:hypothetical protein J4H86_10050 [Spiractinospora alimapuensis]